MSRSFPGEEPSRTVALSSSTGSSASRSGPRAPGDLRAPGTAWDFWAARVFFVVCTAAFCYTLEPFHLHGWPAAGTGFLMALAILLAEWRLRRAAASGWLGGAFGGILGIFAALLVTLVVSRS